MTPKAQLLAHLAGQDDGSPLYVPNLSLWYEWHAGRGTLPEGWKGFSLVQVLHALDAPTWLTSRCFRLDRGGVKRLVHKRAGERVIRHVAPSGTLVERWSLGPDGDWWQTEYPVKTIADLEILKEIIERRAYTLRLVEARALAGELGDDGVVALELPRRPFAQLCLEWLGWTDGLMLLMDATDLVDEILTALESKVQALVAAVAALPFDVAYSPDNLDAAFISPGYFRSYLAESFGASAEIMHRQARLLITGTGGPIRRLLPLLAETGVDGIDGIAGPPQSDATLEEARALTGPGLALWGGIPQDVLLPACSDEEFQASVRQAARAASGHRGLLIGVADRVPVDADLSRLKAIPDVIRDA